MLVTTNLLARGYDEKKVSLVINLDLPIKHCENPEDAEVDVANYLHRVGRAGRFGRLGLAVSIVTDEKDMKMVEEIKAH